MEATGARIIKYGNRDAKFPIYDVADIHYGNRGCAKSHLVRDIERIINNPYALWFLGGDYCDWIHWTDKRFDPESFDTSFAIKDMTSLAAILQEKLLEYLLPVRSQCIGALMGNHEHTYMTSNSQSFIHDEMCKALGVPNMRYTGWCDVYFVHEEGFEGVEIQNGSCLPPSYYTAKIRVLISHGFGAAATAGGKINALKRLMDMSYDADVCFMGHLHEQFSRVGVRLQPNATCTEIKERAMMGVLTGTYLRGYSSGFVSYGEKRGYAPTSLSASRCIYDPIERRLVAENAADNVGQGM